LLDLGAASTDGLGPTLEESRIWTEGMIMIPAVANGAAQRIEVTLIATTVENIQVNAKSDVTDGRASS
jgi:hypothetical protein